MNLTTANKGARGRSTSTGKQKRGKKEQMCERKDTKGKRQTLTHYPTSAPNVSAMLLCGCIDDYGWSVVAGRGGRLHRICSSGRVETRCTLMPDVHGSLDRSNYQTIYVYIKAIKQVLPGF